MKVKLFTNTGDVKKLENELNEWLETYKKTIDIQEIRQSYAYDGSGMSSLISVWYFEVP